MREVSSRGRVRSTTSYTVVAFDASISPSPMTSASLAIGVVSCALPVALLTQATSGNDAPTKTATTIQWLVVTLIVPPDCHPMRRGLRTDVLVGRRRSG